MGNISFIYQRIRVDKRDIFIRYFRYFNLLRFRFFIFFNNYNRIFVQLFIRLDRIEDEMQSWRLNGIPWGLQKWPMSAISKGRSGRQAAGKSYYSLFLVQKGSIEPRPNSPSAVIRIDAREKPTLRINQSNRSIRRACDRLDEPPCHYRLWCPLPSSLSLY